MVAFYILKYLIHKSPCFPTFVFEGFGRDDAHLVQPDAQGEPYPFFIHAHSSVAQADILGIAGVRVRMPDVFVEIALVWIYQPDGALDASPV